MVGQLSSRTRHRVLAVAALHKNLSMVWWHWHISVSQLLLLIYGSLFLSGIYYCLRVFWCAAARMSELELEQRTNIKFPVKLGKSGNEIREMLGCKLTGIMLWRKQQFTLGETFFWGKRMCHWRREIRTASNKQNWRKHCKIRQIVRENRRLSGS